MTLTVEVKRSIVLLSFYLNHFRKRRISVSQATHTEFPPAHLRSPVGVTHREIRVGIFGGGRAWGGNWGNMMVYFLHD